MKKLITSVAVILFIIFMSITEQVIAQPESLESLYNKALTSLKNCEAKYSGYEAFLKNVKARPGDYKYSDFLMAEEGMKNWKLCIDRAKAVVEQYKKMLPEAPNINIEGEESPKLTREQHDKELVNLDQLQKRVFKLEAIYDTCKTDLYSINADNYDKWKEMDKSNDTKQNDGQKK